MYKKIIALLVFAFVSVSYGGKGVFHGGGGWNNCGPPESVLSLTISNCSHEHSHELLHDEYCQFQRGFTHDVEITAITFASSQALPFVTTIFVGEPIVLETGDICNRFVGPYSCPLQTYQPFTFNARILVPVEVPSINASITINARDENGVTRVCVNIPAEVV